MSVAIGLSSNIHWDGAFRVCFAVASSDREIFGVILNILGNDHQLLFIPPPIMGIRDIDGVVVAALRVIENEANRWSIVVVGFVCDSVIVDGAEGNAECIILWECLGMDGELRQCGWVSGCIFWG